MNPTVFEAGGRQNEINADDLHDRLAASRLCLPAPFAAERVRLVASVADAIVRRKSGVSPSIKYLGFWTRAAALRKLEQDFLARCPPATLSRPRGLVFHLPPKNVETIFLYSWILSYLAGNANIVRMPRDMDSEVVWVLDQILSGLEAAGDPVQMFVHYPADDGLSARISACSDARVVWGGDAKIAAFERMPLRNGGKSIWFGDRSSLCVIHGAELAALDVARMDELAQRFANDIFTFDQMACSSPHALYVVGCKDHHLATVKTLLEKIGLLAAGRGNALATGQQIAKMTAGFSAAASGDAGDVLWRHSELTSVISSSGLRADRRVGGGFLTVAFIDDLADLNTLLRDKDQTITHFGFTASDIRRAAERNLGPGVARWTPVGSALEFDSIWDGYDILGELTRFCRVG